MRFKNILTPALFLIPALLAGLGCSKNYQVPPLSPSSSGVSTNPNGPLIEALYMEYFVQDVMTQNEAIVLMVDNSGNPITTASVTFVVSGASYPLTYFNNQTLNAPANMGLTNIYGGFYYNPVSYTGGASCAFQVALGANNYACNFTSAQVSAGSVTNSSGITCTWSGGNDDAIRVVGNDNFQEGPTPPINSPYFLPASDFPLDPAGSGQDDVQLYVFGLVKPAFSGAQSSSVVVSGYEWDTHY